ncbi:unnamed protein product [Spirodela intermedia]|uniref:SP-RING-type domain-containing protein n=1 Tax=Spirodela intermedia TaxID=51605 RepID=A0A7I8KY36_SPIIN|nr:unnamed protein product [Spirodela intermedia]
MVDAVPLGRHPAATSSPGVAAAAVVPVAAVAPNKELPTRSGISWRIAFVVDRITSWLKCGSRNDPCNLMQPFYLLARFIDFSVTAGEVYAGAHDLPPLIKQVYKFRNEASLQPAIMMLLISVKNACRHGWFQDADGKELIAMANEISRNFCSGSFFLEESKALSVISIIMPRFYPQLKFDNLLVSFEAKPGYDILVADFIIPRNIRPQTKIMLFVSQTDNMETSSCLISPPHVNFIVNGRAVERRTIIFSDIGPQFPTDITELLKYGTNLIQAFGFFGGHYIIAVSLMSTIPSSEIPLLQDYVPSVAATVPPDAEIIEGPSKISLNCPISFRRIKTPVKGHLCKHHQCFDYENYMAMNAKRPCWRCPHCNQPVSCVDIRIDQHMGKVLAETGEDATHVILDSNGSWKVVEYRDTAEKLDSGMEADETFDSFGCEASRASTGLSAVVDLTMEAEDSQGAPGTSPRQIEPSDNLPYQDRDGGQCVPEDGKPFQDASRGVSFISSAQSRSCTLEAIRASQGQSGHDLASRVSVAIPASLGRLHVQPVLGSLPQCHSTDPVITDAASPALSREGAEMASLSSAPRQFMDSFQFLQTHAVSSSAGEIETQPIPRHVNRVPLAIQALPAQTQVPSYHHQRAWTAAARSGPVPSVPVQTSPSMPFIPDEISPANTETGRQPVSRASGLGLPSFQVHSAFQYCDSQHPRYTMNPATLNVGGLPAQNPVNSRSLPSQQRGEGSLGTHLQGGGQTTQQPYHNLWLQQAMNQGPSIAPLSRLPPAPVHQQTTQSAINPVAGGTVNNIQVPALQTPRMPSFLSGAALDSFVGSGGENARSLGEVTPEGLGRSGGAGEATAEQSWRPSGRMRGSLTGSEYSSALSHYTVRPSR